MRPRGVFEVGLTNPLVHLGPVRPLKAGDRVFLVDGSGYIFRAYHALPPLTRKSDGLQINAVKRLIAFLKKMEFNTLTRRVAEAAGVDPTAFEPIEALKVEVLPFARAARKGP